LSKQDILDKHKERRFNSSILNNTRIQDGRDYKGRFKKGISGNPKGITKELRDKYTKLKHDLIDLVYETGAIDKIREEGKKGKSLDKIVDRASDLIPKEQAIKHEGIKPNITVVVSGKPMVNKEVLNNSIEKDIKESESDNGKG